MTSATFPQKRKDYSEVVLIIICQVVVPGIRRQVHYSARSPRTGASLLHSIPVRQISQDIQTAGYNWAKLCIWTGSWQLISDAYGSDRKI